MATKGAAQTHTVKIVGRTVKSSVQVKIHPKHVRITPGDVPTCGWVKSIFGGKGGRGK